VILKQAVGDSGNVGPGNGGGKMVVAFLYCHVAG
jgi:hypothetical protein